MKPCEYEISGQAVKSGYREVNGLKLHVVEAGPEDGPLVLLLHGFPDFWRGWESQISFLAKAGFRVLVPDQRGYHLSEKPEGIKNYNMDRLSDDVVALIRACGRERASVVGHDWGGAVAWFTANKHPDRVEKLVILNMPHPEVMKSALFRNPRQILKSWYVLFFQLPWLPEFFLKNGRYRLLLWLLKKDLPPPVISDWDFVDYQRAWSLPGAMRSMIHWYRAGLQAPPRELKSPKIKPPTLVLWGTKDPYLGKELVKPSLELCEKGEWVLFDDAGHWIQREKPDEVNRRLVEFLARPRPLFDIKLS